MKTLLNTLYVTTPDAYLRLEGETVCVMVEKEKRLQVPLHHLGGFVCFGHTMMSPALLSRCAEEGRSVVWLDRIGRFGARLEGPVSGNILLRQAQHKTADDADQSLDLARSFIAGKLRNSRQVLLRSARDAKDEEDQTKLGDAAQRIGHILEKLANASNHDAVRGYEGDAARLYFGALNLAIRPQARNGFAFDTRSRRPPRDPINALLSFLYAVLLNDCRSALETVGLDPQLGYLHSIRPGRPALALDLMEEFRSVIADRLVLTLVNRRQIQESDFDHRDGGAVMLNDAGRKTVITAYQERKQESLKHPLLEEPIPIGLLPHIQARLLARVLRGDTEGYLPYLHR
jgi:CRISPR-associated protein Cas1